MPGSWPPQDFPDLTDADYIGTSPLTRRYNCIAWSIGNTAAKWWPDPWGVGAWTPGLPRTGNVAAFVTMYEARGYQICPDGSLEAGFEKIALYTVPGPMGLILPTHAAYQLANGNWTSKLGDFEDIEHFQVEKLNGPRYGSVHLYMKRPRQPRPAPPNH